MNFAKFFVEFFMSFYKLVENKKFFVGFFMNFYKLVENKKFFVGFFMNFYKLVENKKFFDNFRKIILFFYAIIKLLSLFIFFSSS